MATGTNTIVEQTRDSEQRNGMEIKKELLTQVRQMEGKARARCLWQSDIDRFLELVAANPTKRVRVYSSEGFVPNSYKYKAEISYVEYDPNTRDTWVGRSGAQRSYGNGNTEVVQAVMLAPTTEVEPDWDSLLAALRVRKSESVLGLTAVHQGPAGRAAFVQCPHNGGDVPLSDCGNASRCNFPTLVGTQDEANRPRGRGLKRSEAQSRLLWRNQTQATQRAAGKPAASLSSGSGIVMTAVTTGAGAEDDAGNAHGRGQDALKN